MKSQIQTDHRKGLMITAMGGLLLTVDVPLLVLSGADTANMLFLRGPMAAFALFLWWAFYMRKQGTPLFQGRATLITAGLSFLQNVAFIGAINHSNVSNVIFILAFNPMFSALVSWIFLKERISPGTIAAMLASFIGVVIIVWDSIGQGTLWGDLMALSCALLLAITLSYTRATGKDLSLTPGYGMILSSIFAAPFANPGMMSASGMGYMALNGFFIAPASFALLSLGPRYIAAAEVAMFFLLETCLTPVWMWLIFGDMPPSPTLIGGAIIITALGLHSFAQLIGRKKRKAAVSQL